MGQNAVSVRQKAVLRQITTNRWTTISDMAAHHCVSTKTIRRDLAGLIEAGFPLYDERIDGKVYWHVAGADERLPQASTGPVLPGGKTVRLGRSILASTTFERVLMPLITDMQAEWKTAADSGQYVRACMFRFGAYLQLVSALIMHCAIVVAKKTGLVWNSSVSSEKTNEKQ